MLEPIDDPETEADSFRPASTPESSRPPVDPQDRSLARTIRALVGTLPGIPGFDRSAGRSVEGLNFATTAEGPRANPFGSPRRVDQGPGLDPAADDSPIEMGRPIVLPGEPRPMRDGRLGDSASADAPTIRPFEANDVLREPRRRDGLPAEAPRDRIVAGPFAPESFSLPAKGDRNAPFDRSGISPVVELLTNPRNAHAATIEIPRWLEPGVDQSDRMRATQLAAPPESDYVPTSQPGPFQAPPIPVLDAPRRPLPGMDGPSQAPAPPAPAREPANFDFANPTPAGGPEDPEGGLVGGISRAHVMLRQILDELRRSGRGGFADGGRSVYPER